jgi:hypothetical protein
VSNIRAWTGEEESLLREKYLSIPVKTLAEALGRSVPSVDNKPRRLGLKKPDDSSIILPTTSSFRSSFEMMTREDAQKLDKIDLLRATGASSRRTDVSSITQNSPSLRGTSS